MSTKLSTELLSLAGEYAVASELCRRGAYAQLTLGNRKRTDILVDTDRCLTRIEVKAAQGGEWPAIRGLQCETDLLVLVDFTKKSLADPPDFYVLDFSDWQRMIREEQQRVSAAIVDAAWQITYPDGWKGLNLRPQTLAEHKDRWEKIIERVTRSTVPMS